MGRNLIVTMFLLVLVVESRADGKVFWTEKVPPQIPYQRAIILFRDGRETLVLQSRYKIHETSTTTSLGWVVPVPAVPEVASLPADTATNLFRWLSMNTAPRVWRIGPSALVGIGTLSLLGLLLCLLSLVIPFPAWFQARRAHVVGISLAGLLACVLLGVTLIPSMLARGSEGGVGSPGVDVIAEHHAGIYDVRVVRSDDAGDLISWLDANKFNYGAEDKAAFDAYISRGWCFVVANVNSTAEQDGRVTLAQGLADPLILRFSNDKAVYPLALTATGNHDTQVLLYLAADTKMSCDHRLRLRFAGERRLRILEMLSEQSQPKGFFDAEEVHQPYPYLCKFRDRLSPAEMKEDIVFTPARNNTPHRERVFRW